MSLFFMSFICSFMLPLSGVSVTHVLLFLAPLMFPRAAVFVIVLVSVAPVSSMVPVR